MTRLQRSLGAQERQSRTRRIVRAGGSRKQQSRQGCRFQGVARCNPLEVTIRRSGPHCQEPYYPVTHPALDCTSQGTNATIKATGLVFAAWCLGFAAVNAWQLATGRLTDGEFGDYTTVLTVMSVLVLLLKLLGACMALASLRIVHHHRVRWLLGAALWAATSTLALYSAGNLIITFGTVTGPLEPAAAWESTGGVTIRAAAYVLFFPAGAAMSAALAVSYHRRHRLHGRPSPPAHRRPALLGGLLVALPALLTTASPR